MKKFNTAVMAAWLGMFLLSLHINPEDPATLLEERGFHRVIGEIVYNFNETIWFNCNWCAEPSEPVRVFVGANQPIYQDNYASATDNRLTQTILRNTFFPLLMLMFALNAAFYAGKIGGNGQWTAAKATAKTATANFLTSVFRRLRRKKEEKAPDIAQAVEVEA